MNAYGATLFLSLFSLYMAMQAASPPFDLWAVLASLMGALMAARVLSDATEKP